LQEGMAYAWAGFAAGESAVVDPRNRYLVNSTRLPQLLGRVAFARST
jgi:hypothetical protein